MSSHSGVALAWLARWTSGDQPPETTSRSASRRRVSPLTCPDAASKRRTETLDSLLLPRVVAIAWPVIRSAPLCRAMSRAASETRSRTSTIAATAAPAFESASAAA